MRTFLLSVSAIALAACGAPAASDSTPAAPAASVAEATAGPADAPAPELGPAGTYDLDPTHASLTWKVNHFGLSNYTARFTGISGTLVFDPENLSASSLEVSVDPASVETDYPADFKAGHPDSPFDTFDQEISESDAYFNSTVFPTITFKSTEITPTGANTGTVTGDLTFRGVTKPVTLDVTYNGTASFPWAPDQPKIGFSATGSLKRSDFGLDIMVPSLGDEVDLLIEVEFAKAADAE
ncbi:MAG: polyisoprenoid-binding protein [Rhodobacterales bacterium]|jgi:polyisoprenoid-binding protein YceI|nr:polyisoprenoid-binding protein [Rhodobacterales bacterium]